MLSEGGRQAVQGRACEQHTGTDNLYRERGGMRWRVLAQKAKRPRRAHGSTSYGRGEARLPHVHCELFQSPHSAVNFVKLRVLCDGAERE